MSDIVHPALVAFGFLVAYWVLANALEFLWNLTHAGNRLEIDRLKQARPTFEELQRLILLLRERSAKLVAYLASGVEDDAIKGASAKYDEVMESLSVTSTVN